MNVPYSAEFRDTTSNDALLASLGGQTPDGGGPGRVLELDSASAGPPSEVSVFRHDLARATSRQSCWHLVLLAGVCLFFCDVLNRRVAISSQDLSLAAHWAARWVPWRKKAAAAPSDVMDRLRERKESIAQQLDSRRRASQFELSQFESASPPPDAPRPDIAPHVLAALAPGPAPREITPEEQEESYTARLLRAKRRALER